MASVDSVHAHLVEELTDLRDVETQLTEALPKLAQWASSKELRAASAVGIAHDRSTKRSAGRQQRSMGRNRLASTKKR
jgi:ferritin-like metal-binding protein YciE